MELGYVVTALLGALWARSAWRARRAARELAMRRVDFVEYGDWYSDSWTFDFAEMLAVNNHSITDWPARRSNILYELRRQDGPTWEIRLHHECQPHRLREFEEFAQQSHWSKENLDETRRSIQHPNWQPIDDHRSAELEMRYQVFLRHHAPTVEIREAGLKTYWHRLMMLEERDRSREKAEAPKP